MSDQFKKQSIPETHVVRLKRPDAPQVQPISLKTEDSSSIHAREPLFKPATPKKNSPTLIAAFVATGLGIIGGAILFWYMYNPAMVAPQQTSQQKTTSAATSSAASTTAVAEIVRRVGALMALPTDEEPTLAMVRDVATLKDQAFFKNAKNGDFVLMYAKARRAILFDSIGNRIVEVAPIVDTPTKP